MMTMELETKNIEACIKWARDAADEEFKHPRAARAELAALVKRANFLPSVCGNGCKFHAASLDRAESAEAEVARLRAEVDRMRPVVEACERYFGGDPDCDCEPCKELKKYEKVKAGKDGEG